MVSSPEVRSQDSNREGTPMKKVGILLGQEETFPWALIERVNSRNVDGITAEPVRIEKLIQGEPSGYAVIVDRISQDVPF